MQKYLIPFLVFVVGFYLIGIRLVGFNFDGIPGDMGDGRLNNYFLEQGYLFLTNQIDNYWDAPFFHPEKSTMSMSDNLFGTLPIYAFFRWIKMDRETAYQSWFLVLLALNYITCFFTLKKLNVSPFASAIGAFIFAFSLPVAGGIGHIQMLPKFAFPLIIYCLIKFIHNKQAKYLFFFLLLSVYQMYCGIYLGFMSIFASLLVFFVMFFSVGVKKELNSLSKYFRKNWISSAIFFLLSLALMIILLRPYMTRAGQVERNYGDIGEGLPTPLSYLYPSSNSLLWNWMRPIGEHIHNAHEHTLWMGLTGLLAIVIGIYLMKSKKKPQVKFWLCCFVAIIIITMNFYGHISFYVGVYIIPGFEAVRAVSRIVQLELFFLGGLVAIIIDQLVKSNWTSSKQWIVFSLIIIFVVIDQIQWKSGLNSFSKKNDQYRVAVLKDRIKEQYTHQYSAFVYLPSSHFEVYKFHVDAMLASQDLGIPTINGYSAFSPRLHEKFFEWPNQNTLAMIIDGAVLNEDKILMVKLNPSISLPPQ